MNEYSDIFKAVSEIIKINSEQSEPAQNAPFGLGARRALDYFLDLEL